MPQFSIQSISLVLVGLVNLVLGFLIYSKERKNKSNILFAMIALSVAAWVLSRALFEIVPIGTWNCIITYVLYVSASLIPLFFVLFAYTFPSEKIGLSKKNLSLTVLPCVAVVLATLIPGVVIKEIFQSPDTYKVIVFGWGYIYYSIYIVGYFSWGFINLLLKYLKESGLLKTQLRYILLGTFIATIFGVLTNLIFPAFNSFKFFWLGPVLSVIMTVFIAYAIAKHHLLNIKLIATEIFSVSIVLVVLAELFFAKSGEELVARAIIVLLVSLFAYLLVRGAIKELKEKEEKEKMATELLLANIHLKELDKAKSDFISIASHQLRSPVTAIKGYSSMILENSYGPITKKLKDPVEKIFESSRRLVLTIGDFLDVSKIESGNMQYDFVKFDIKEMLTSLTDEFKNALTSSGASARDSISKVKKDIKFELDIAEGEDYNVTADQNKIRQVLSNLTDNAIKYTPKGFVKISLRKDMNGPVVLVKIKDSGIGMTQATIDKLFQKFTRADGISKMHTDGSGLGLFVGREVVRAHGGSIWAESEGEGKGSTFCVRLPVNKIVSTTKPAPVNVLSGLGFMPPENTSVTTQESLATKNVESFIKKL